MSGHHRHVPVWRQCLYRVVLVLASALSLTASGRERAADIENNLTMRPSVTYLHLLRHTPFFTALSTEQLQWVINHSHEWEVDAGAALSKNSPQGSSDNDYWVLLDGEWQLDYDGRSFPSGHASPGKWFHTREARDKQVVLIATEHSYVMRIADKDMQVMLDQGFAFDTHLEQGRTYYRDMFIQ